MKVRERIVLFAASTTLVLGGASVVNSLMNPQIALAGPEDYEGCFEFYCCDWSDHEYEEAGSGCSTGCCGAAANWWWSGCYGDAASANTLCREACPGPDPSACEQDCDDAMEEAVDGEGGCTEQAENMMFDCEDEYANEWQGEFCS